MLDRYKLFLKEFDEIINSLFENQKRYINCKKGCSKCCEKGDYPFSQLEFAYLTQGFLSLPPERKIKVQHNIRQYQTERKYFKEERYEHQCPFLINGECCVYEYRGIVCRTFGLCYYDDINGYVKLPDCVHDGLNYSEFYDADTRTLNIQNVPKVNLRIDRVLKSQLAEKYELESGEIRAMLDWLEQK